MAAQFVPNSEEAATVAADFIGSKSYFFSVISPVVDHATKRHEKRSILIYFAEFGSPACDHATWSTS
jgi:hypothetical protein